MEEDIIMFDDRLPRFLSNSSNADLDAFSRHYGYHHLFFIFIVCNLMEKLFNLYYMPIPCTGMLIRFIMISWYIYSYKSTLIPPQVSQVRSVKSCNVYTTIILATSTVLEEWFYQYTPAMGV